MNTPTPDQIPCNCNLFEDPEMREGSYVVCGAGEVVCNANNGYMTLPTKGHYGLSCVNDEYFMQVTIEEIKHFSVPITHCPFCGRKL